MGGKEWTVYIIRTEAGTLYTGITVDLDNRLANHKEGGKGAKFFKFSSPDAVVYQERHPNRSEATKREIVIKKMSRAEKEALVQK